MNKYNLLNFIYCDFLVIGLVNKLISMDGVANVTVLLNMRKVKMVQFLNKPKNIFWFALILLIAISFFGLYGYSFKFYDFEKALNLSLFIPFKLQIFFQKYNNLKQNIYDKITFFLIEKKYSTFIIVFCHKILFYFRYYSVNFGEKIENYISLNMLALIISIICSRLHVAGYLIIFILLFIRLDYAVVHMSRFYKKHPILLDKHILRPNIVKRSMFKGVGKIVEEAANNPQVQALAVAAVGAVAWKALDVWDTYKAADIAAEDREVTVRNANADRELAERNAKADRELAERNAEADRELTRENAKADREQQERHHADEMKMRERELNSGKKEEN